MGSTDMVAVFYANRRKVNQGRPDGWLGRLAAEDHVTAELATWTCNLQKAIRLKRTEAEMMRPAPSVAMPSWVVERAADGDAKCLEIAAAWKENATLKLQQRSRAA